MFKQHFRPRLPGRRATAAMIAGAAALGASAPAQAATYPTAGGSTFGADAQGWSSLRAQCSAASGTPVCTQQNAHDPQDGNPPGAIVARTVVTANAGQLLRGDSTWRSPSFVAQANSGTGVLQYDRRFEVEGIVALNPQTSINALVVDETTGATRSLGNETLTDADSAFVSRRLTVPAGTLIAGRSYRIELRSTTTTNAIRLGVLGTAEVEYDNVRLGLPDPSGASGSPGVNFVASALSNSAIRELISQLSIATNVGNGPGGSLVPLARCTILGTPGKDRIRGTRGNDVICGLGGSDRIAGGRGRDVIDGANGGDRLNGAAGADLLLGLRGRDRLRGGSGKDRAGSGAASDRLAVRDRKRDTVDGGKGRDRARVDRRRGGKRIDRVRRVERVR
jgi:Ca2+-binding RTX toxin-like protein